MSDTFFICPRCGSIEGQPEVQWTCTEGHVLTRASGMNGKTKINHNGDIMLVGQLAKDSQDSTERALGSPPYAKNSNIDHLFDKFGDFRRSQCPICEAELRATLCQCERCHKVFPPEHIIVKEVVYGAPLVLPKIRADTSLKLDLAA